MSALSLTAAHQQFIAALPAIDRTLKFKFRRLPSDRRAEAIGDARAAAWAARYGLVRRGKDPLAVGASGIAYNATGYVKRGRKLGCGATGRAAIDVYDRRAHRAGLGLVSLNRDAGDEPGSRGDAWRESLCEDNRVSPADKAAFRVDLEAWLGTLPTRKRRIAELLAQRHETGVVAGTVGVSPSLSFHLTCSTRSSTGQVSHVAPVDTAPEGRARHRISRIRGIARSSLAVRYCALSAKCASQISFIDRIKIPAKRVIIM